MGDVTIRLRSSGLRAALNAPEAQAAVLAEAERIASSAQAAGAGFHTKQFKRKGVWVGGKRPKFGADVRAGKGGAVALVYTANYAAAKYNAKTNALLKAKGGAL